MEYRAGNSKVNHPIKVNGVYKVGDVTFKRGLIGALDLYLDRLDPHRRPHRAADGARDAAGRGPRGPGDDLDPDQRPADALHRAELNAKTGTDVAIEELVLSIEDLTIE